MTKLRIGARGSALSMAQTGQLRAALAATAGWPKADIEIVPIVTSGDRIQDRRLIDAGGKGLFTKELDEALLDGRIDCAVHSLKDVPTQLPDGVVLAAVPAREDARDAFVSPRARTLNDLPQGARLGTASLRRQAQALAARPDLTIVTLRGNIDTRIRKLEAGDADATFLALAGLRRLGVEHVVTSLIDDEAMPPAAGQGALAATARAGDARVLDVLQGIEHAPTRVEIAAERAFLAALDGSCRTPIAARGRCEGTTLRFVGETLTPDGAMRWRREGVLENANAQSAAALAHAFAREIRAEAGARLFTER
jgi:hydroxymethylbilane synthase